MTSAEHVIETHALRREFGSFVAVRDVSFFVKRGEIFGYLGANGAGKSTTIRMLCGLLRPTSGSAVIAGHDVSRVPRCVKESIGYMSQKFSLYLDLSVGQNFEFFGGIYGLAGRALERAIDRAVERTFLGEHRSASTGSLPGGIRQRVALACALLHDPSIVFLDEPTAGVDPASRRSFWRLIRELARDGTTVFVTTHYMDEAEYCARIGLMVGGELVALDSPAALKARYVPGEIIAIEGRDLHRAAPALRGLPGVFAAEPFGAHLHVRFEPRALDAQRLVEFLRRHGARPSSLTSVEASLENVFLAVVGARQEAT